MKKFLLYLVAIGLVTAILFLPGKADAWLWIPYDNFEEPAIDTEKWDERKNTAAIDIENGMVCFTHPNSTAPGISNWLVVKKYVKYLRGIRADIFVESCSGDVRGRIAGTIGDISTDRVFGQLSLQGGLGIAQTWASKMETGKS